jgi:cell division protein FtsA
LGDVVKNPIYATASGLLLYGKKHGSQAPVEERGSVGRMFAAIRRWFRGLWGRRNNWI